MTYQSHMVNDRKGLGSGLNLCFRDAGTSALGDPAVVLDFTITCGPA